MQGPKVPAIVTSGTVISLGIEEASCEHSKWFVSCDGEAFINSSICLCFNTKMNHETSKPKDATQRGVVSAALAATCDATRRVAELD